MSRASDAQTCLRFSSLLAAELPRVPVMKFDQANNLDVKQKELGMPLLTGHIYRSPNGDRWRLVRDPISGRKFVRHEPKRASVRVTDTELDEFLSINGPGPEYASIRQFLRDKGADA
jgi:hypothetical protein